MEGVRVLKHSHKEVVTWNAGLDSSPPPVDSVTSILIPSHVTKSVSKTKNNEAVLTTTFDSNVGRSQRRDCQIPLTFWPAHLTVRTDCC